MQLVLGVCLFCCCFAWHHSIFNIHTPIHTIHTNILQYIQPTCTHGYSYGCGRYLLVGSRTCSKTKQETKMSSLSTACRKFEQSVGQDRRSMDPYMTSRLQYSIWPYCNIVQHIAIYTGSHRHMVDTYNTMRGIQV